MCRINDVNVRIRNTVSFRFIIPLSFFHLYYYCIIQVTRSLINLIPHLNGSSIGEVPSRLLKVLFALERMKWRYIGRISWRYDISEKKKKKEFIGMNATHLHEVDYCLDGILQSLRRKIR